VNRVFLISTRRSPPEKSLYFDFQRGSGFRWQTDGSGDGQQHRHAVRHGFAKGGLQTFNESGRNLIEPQTRLGGVTLASAAPFEGCDVNSNPFPSDHDIGAGGSLPFSHVAENRLATASMAVRSCFFKSLMLPYLWRLIPLCAKRRNRVFLAIDGVVPSTQSFLVTVCMVLSPCLEIAHCTKFCYPARRSEATITTAFYGTRKRTQPR